MNTKGNTLDSSKRILNNSSTHTSFNEFHNFNRTSSVIISTHRSSTKLFKRKTLKKNFSLIRSPEFNEYSTNRGSELLEKYSKTERNFDENLKQRKPNDFLKVKTHNASDYKPNFDDKTEKSLRDNYKFPVESLYAKNIYHISREFKTAKHLNNENFQSLTNMKYDEPYTSFTRDNIDKYKTFYKISNQLDRLSDKSDSNIKNINLNKNDNNLTLKHISYFRDMKEKDMNGNNEFLIKKC